MLKVSKGFSKTSRSQKSSTKCSGTPGGSPIGTSVLSHIASVNTYNGFASCLANFPPLPPPPFC